ncbi:hypothetical protein [Elizabethkingia anophelis]|uniref:hypothetical protein n=1 Tax=Elizabethkingia anophelis TaxID=1117645 RepID=UPI00075123F0|nr:hypothetical protein [Elizabethkingia anophelis]AQW91317.1 hypothetical protein BBD28_11915 [Elizabethkingia anophelis]KUY14183.1 hypothetical protein ATB94_09295 [Elizabethkingia anophelis]
MNSIDKVNNICKSVLILTDKDFEAVSEMAREQSDYIHPLNGEKQEKFNSLGNHNQRVLMALRTLKDVIESGKPKS